MTITTVALARDLGAPELLALVREVADDGDLLTELGDAPARGERRYVSLRRDDHVDVWLIAWGEEGDTGWHDHDTSAGAVQVVAGTVVESRPRLGGSAEQRAMHAGDGVEFGPDHIHRLVGGAPGSVTVHAYSPPLWRMGQYSFTPEGAMLRRSVSYAEELRPLT